MKDRFTISGLRQKRARIAGEIEAAERKLIELRAAVINLDAITIAVRPEKRPGRYPHHSCEAEAQVFMNEYLLFAVWTD